MFRRVAATPKFTGAVRRNYVTHENHNGHGEASFGEIFFLACGTVAGIKIVAISGEK